MDSFSPPGLGWHQSFSDFRDYGPEDCRVQDLLDLVQPGEDELPDQIDLSEYFPEVRHQGEMQTSSVHAGLALLEYFERRTTGRLIDLSRMFVYHTSRSLMKVRGNCGCDLRTVLKAIAWYGAPKESHWPYEFEKIDNQPTPFVYASARKYRPLVYVRLDRRNCHGSATLRRVREFLKAGFPVAFGFPVPSSLSACSDIPYRPALDSLHGGQAVVAVGYDDRRAGSTRGALQIRNSWGRQWGEEGYGWLPYRYIEEQLAAEFWTILHPSWLQSGEFTNPLVAATSSSAESESGSLDDIKSRAN